MKRWFFCILTCLCVLFTAARASAEESFRMSPEELQAEIRQIRSWYNDPGEGVEKMEIPGGTDGWEWDAEYCFHDGELFFAFLYRGTEEERFYYSGLHLIRYIDSDGNRYDWPDLGGYEQWGQRVLEEALSHYGGQISAAPDPEPGTAVDLLAGRYEDAGGDQHFLISADLLLDSLFLTRVGGDGVPLEEFRMAWQDKRDEYLFVAGDGQEMSYARLVFLPEQNRLLLYEGEAREPVIFYGGSACTDRDLEILSRQYYLTENYGTYPEFVVSEGEDGFGRACIHLYDMIRETDGYSHASTADWYYVDRETLEAEDFLGNLFQLNLLEAEDASGF